MSDYIEPGEGWREADHDDDMLGDKVEARINGLTRTWVREQPLPTTPYTVIEPHWKPGQGPVMPKVIRFAMTLHEDGHWRGMGWFRTTESLQKQITGFELLSEPRALADGKYAEKIRRETAKEVIDYIEDYMGQGWSVFDRARERFKA